MTLKNVSLIVAPNLVPMSALGSQNKEVSCILLASIIYPILVTCLIKYTFVCS